MVELIISLAILSVGLVGAMRVFPVGLRASQRAELSSRAAIAAQRTIESLKLQPWEALAKGQTTAELDEFDVTTQISQPASLGHLADSSRIKTVQVSVQGEEGGRVRTITFVTYLRRDSS